MTPQPCRHSWLVARLHEEAGRTWASYQCEYCGALSEEQSPAPAPAAIASWTALLCAVLVCAAALWLLLQVADRLDGVR